MTNSHSEQSKESSVRRSSVRKAIARASLAALLALPAFALPASAADTAPDGATIEAFIGTNLVNVQGYPANQRVTIEVLRKGVMIGSVTGNTDGEGFAEFNHAGGGQVPQGDCFAGEATPDILPGDVIRTKNAIDAVNGSATVRNLDVDFDRIKTSTTNNTITVSGHARGTENAPIRKRDVLELRLNKGNPDNRWETGPGLTQDRPGRKDLRVDINRLRNAQGEFTRVLRVSHNDALDWKRNPGEVSLEWSIAGAEEAAPPAIFVADEAGGEAIAGCPPPTRYGITKSSVKAINQAFVKGDAPLVLSGRSFNASAVKVKLNDKDRTTAPVVIKGQPSQQSGHQSWTASARNGQVARLSNGMITARATYTVNRDVFGNPDGPATFSGKNIKILKDTVAPTRAPKASPGPGLYTSSQSVSLSARKGLKIYYTVNNTRPTASSRVFTRPIRVTGTQTIRAISVDRAGNASPIGRYRYVIR